MPEIRCHHCSGTGMAVMSHRCPDCDGHPAQFGDCRLCGTEGWLAIEQPCDECGGRGTCEIDFD